MKSWNQIARMPTGKAIDQKSRSLRVISLPYSVEYSPSSSPQLPPGQRMNRRRREEERVRRPLRERSTGRSGKTKTGVSARRRVLASAMAWAVAATRFIVKSVVSMRFVVMPQVYRLHTELSRRSYVTWVTPLSLLLTPFKCLKLVC